MTPYALAAYTEPRVKRHFAQHLAVIKTQVALPQIHRHLPPLLPEVQAWLAACPVAAAQQELAAFIKGNVFAIETHPTGPANKPNPE